MDSPQQQDIVPDDYLRQHFPSLVGLVITIEPDEPGRFHDKAMRTYTLYVDTSGVMGSEWREAFNASLEFVGGHELSRDEIIKLGLRRLKTLINAFV